MSTTDLTIVPFTAPQVVFWSQHVSFIIVGVIVITSVRGLLITFTKVWEEMGVERGGWIGDGGG